MNEMRDASDNICLLVFSGRFEHFQAARHQNDPRNLHKNAGYWENLCKTK